MCLSTPGKVISIAGKFALVDFGGIRKKVNIEFLSVIPGDYILSYSGYAIEKLDEKTVKELLGG